MAFVHGKYAKGECAKSGKVMKLHALVEDGYYPGLLVAPEWYEPAQPAPKAVDVTDAIALRNPAPRRDAVDARVSFPVFDVTSGQGGVELFENLGCASQPLADAALYVALYTARPGVTYSSVNECRDAAYAAGGEPLEATAKDGTLHMATTYWPRGFIAATWLLVYDAASADAIFRAHLGSLERAAQGQFIIEWSGMRYVLSANGRCLARITVA